MNESRKIIAYSLLIGALALVCGCATVPKDALKVGPQSVQQRQLETRKFDISSEKEILGACSGVLQDMGFTIRDSDSKVGVISASKLRDATDAGQVALATTSVILSAITGSYSNALETIDKTQEIRASVVTSPSSDPTKMLVRVTFQRVVTNARGQVARLESIKDPPLYQGFFEKLSKSVFLEAQAI